MTNETSVDSHDPLSLFIEQMFRDNQMETDKIPPEVAEQMKSDMRERLDDRINLAILDAMPPEKVEEFDRLMASASDQELQTFCQKNIPQYEAVLANAMVNFRQIYLGHS